MEGNNSNRMFLGHVFYTNSLCFLYLLEQNQLLVVSQDVFVKIIQLKGKDELNKIYDLRLVQHNEIQDLCKNIERAFKNDLFKDDRFSEYYIHSIGDAKLFLDSNLNGINFVLNVFNYESNCSIVFLVDFVIDGLKKFSLESKFKLNIQVNLTDYKLLSSRRDLPIQTILFVKISDLELKEYLSVKSDFHSIPVIESSSKNLSNFITLLQINKKNCFIRYDLDAEIFNNYYFISGVDNFGHLLNYKWVLEQFTKKSELFKIVNLYSHYEKSVENECDICWAKNLCWKSKAYLGYYDSPFQNNKSKLKCDNLRKSFENYLGIVKKNEIIGKIKAEQKTIRIDKFNGQIKKII